MSRNSDDNFMVGALLGIVGGVIAGIMYSPRPGVEMRQELKNMAKDFSKDVPVDVETAKDSFFKRVDKLKVALEKQIDTIDKAVKAKKLASAKRKEEEMDATF